jgi:hypothetical protein
VFRLALANEQDRIPEVAEVLRQLDELLRDPRNIEEFNREIRNAERVDSPFQLERLALKRDVGKALDANETFKFNSVYPLHAAGQKITVNGFSVDFDQKSFDAVRAVIESRKMAGIRESSLITSLVQADVLSIRSAVQ